MHHIDQSILHSLDAHNFPQCIEIETLAIATPLQLNFSGVFRENRQS